jgi:hypothetical protein
VLSSDPLALPADPLPDLRRARGPRLPGVSVLLDAGAWGAAAERAVLRTEAIAAAVAERHEVVVADGPGARLEALGAPGRLEWIVLADAAAAGSLAELGRCLAPAAGHDVVVGRRLSARTPRWRRRGAPPRARAASAGRDRAGGRDEDHPFVLVRRDLARRIARTAGGELPAVDLAVLAVVLGAHVALVRVHDRPAHRPPAPCHAGAGRWEVPPPTG